MAKPCTSDSDCARFTGLCLNSTCTCFSVFGATGENCDIPGQASGGSAGFLAAAFCIVTVFVVYNARTLTSLVLSPTRVFRFNLAGRVFLFGWIALLLTWAAAGVAVAAPFENLLTSILAIDYVSILMLIYSLINLIVGFLRFSMLRNMSHKAFYREYSAVLMLLVIGLFIAVILTLPFEVASYIAGSVFFVTILVAAIAPPALFVKAMESRAQCSKWRILMVAVEDTIFNNNAIFNFVATWDESRTSLTGRQSIEFEQRDSKGEVVVPKDWAASLENSGPGPSTGGKTMSFFDLKLSRNGSFIASDSAALATLPRTGSQASMHQANAEKHRKKSDFFKRSIQAGNSLLVTGLGVCAFWLVFALDLPLQGQFRTDFTVASVFWACRTICLGSAAHVVLKFSGHVYKRNIREQALDRKSRKVLKDEGQEQGETQMRAAASWIQSTEYANARPSSQKALPASGGASEELTLHHHHPSLQAKASDPTLSSRHSSRRLVDEEQRKAPSTTVDDLNRSGVSGVLNVVNKAVEGVIDVWVDETEDDE